MKTYNVALNTGIDYDSFWHEIETDGLGNTYMPNRSVSIVNERPVSLRQCWYELSDEEAEKLRNDPRVYCVEIPPEHRTDIELKLSKVQTGLYYKSPGTNPTNNLGINWGLFRLNSKTNNTPGASGTLDYNYTLDGTGVDFVVSDSGCQIDHPEFTDANGVTRVQQINWYTASGVSGTMPSFATFYTDYDGHGTHCTGIAAGKTYGRAKNSHIYIMPVSGLTTGATIGLDVTDCFDTIKGWHNNKPINPATGYKRPTVVNMSWGYLNRFIGITGGNYRGTSWTGTTKRSDYGMVGSNNYYGTRVNSVDVDIEELLASGVVIVGAAGNYYQTIDVPGGPDYDNYYIGFGSNYYMRGSSPVSAPGVICVGNVSTGYDTPERKLDSSESGPRVDVWAPGTNIVSTTSNTNTFGATTAYPFNGNYKIMSISGSSMASPNVAGLVAQLLQLHPGYTPAQIRNLVIETSTPNMLYTTGLTTDYTRSDSLHGGPNRFAYLPPTFSYIKDSTSTWRQAKDIWVKHNDGTWKQTQSGWKKINGTWQQIY